MTEPIIAQKHYVFAEDESFSVSSMIIAHGGMLVGNNDPGIGVQLNFGEGGGYILRLEAVEEIAKSLLDIALNGNNFDNAEYVYLESFTSVLFRPEGAYFHHHDYINDNDYEPDSSFIPMTAERYEVFLEEVLAARAILLPHYALHTP